MHRSTKRAIPKDIFTESCLRWAPAPEKRPAPNRPANLAVRRWPTALSVVRNISPILSDPVSILQVKTMLTEAEKYVDAAVASEFLGVTTRFLLDLTRAGRIPGHPLGLGSKRRVWRFRLSELDHAIGALTPPAPMAKKP